MIEGTRISRSDKYYWHRYTDVYEPVFAGLRDVRVVVEMGVYHGDSIDWLAATFPDARLIGVDILPVQPDWPVSPRIAYVQADQADRAGIGRVFDALPGPPDLVIEDGSHIPQHQASCLAEGFARLRPGGLYILEDICTSHPLTADFAAHAQEAGRQLPTALHVLMALQHLRETGEGLSDRALAQLAHPAFLSAGDIGLLWRDAAAITIHKRTKLPLRCWSCGGSAFDLVAWRCSCGVALYHSSNSMTALIWKAPPAEPPTVHPSGILRRAARRLMLGQNGNTGGAG